MDRLNKGSVKQLLNLVNLEENYLYLSVYTPSTDHNISNIQTVLKSQILETLKKHDSTALGLHPIYQDIIDEFNSHLSNEKGIKGGIAAFAKFDLENYNKTKKSENFIVIHLPEPPIAESCLGDTFNLGQLAYCIFKNPKILIINIERSTIHLSDYENASLDALTTIENDAIYENKNEYRTTSTGAGTFGNRETIDQRSDNKFDSYFLDKLIDELHKKSYLESDYGMILIYHSSIFTEEINKLAQRVNNLFQLPVEYFSKTFTQSNELIKSIQEYLNEYNENQIDQTLEKANEERRIASGLVEVCNAAREGKIETLLIKPDLKLSGYVLDNEHPYWEKEVDGNYKETTLSHGLYKR